MMEGLVKNLTEVVRKTVKEYLETLMKTERDVFIEETWRSEERIL